MTGQDPVFDQQSIDEIWGTPPDQLYVHVLHLFAEEGERHCAAARDSLRNADWRGLERAAHTMAGAAANVGAGPLAQSARRLMEAIEARPSAALAVPLEDMEAQWRRTAAALAHGR